MLWILWANPAPFIIWSSLHVICKNKNGLLNQQEGYMDPNDCMPATV